MQERARIGTSLVFLLDPGDEIVDNPKLDEEQTKVCAEFLEELIGLGAVKKTDKKL